ncbi:MAG: L-serine ammonia-lyase, iron-sulfur-dependent subunit beta [Bacillota bacterium]
MSVFDMIGPIMIGPSSSHTAGAARLGQLARSILGGQPVRARILLHGSFAETGAGHGTDLALVAGLLGLGPDDERIVDAFQLADAAGLQYNFERVDLGRVHPNTVRFVLEAGDRRVMVTGSSVGGGRVLVTAIDQFPVELSGEYDALVVSYLDQPGVISKISSLLAMDNVNIAQMRVSRAEKGARALMILEVDQPVADEVQRIIGRLPVIDALVAIPRVIGQKGGETE